MLRLRINHEFYERPRFHPYTPGKYDDRNPNYICVLYKLSKSMCLHYNYSMKENAVLYPLFFYFYYSNVVFSSFCFQTIHQTHSKSNLFPSCVRILQNEFLFFQSYSNQSQQKNLQICTANYVHAWRPPFNDKFHKMAWHTWLVSPVSLTDDQPLITHHSDKPYILWQVINVKTGRYPLILMYGFLLHLHLERKYFCFAGTF